MSQVVAPSCAHAARPGVVAVAPPARAAHAIRLPLLTFTSLAPAPAAIEGGTLGGAAERDAAEFVGAPERQPPGQAGRSPRFMIAVLREVHCLELFAVDGGPKACAPRRKAGGHSGRRERRQ